jgi:hypothetical protein
VRQGETAEDDDDKDEASHHSAAHHEDRQKNSFFQTTATKTTTTRTSKKKKKKNGRSWPSYADCTDAMTCPLDLIVRDNSSSSSFSVGGGVKNDLE